MRQGGNHDSEKNSLGSLLFIWLATAFTSGHTYAASADCQIDTARPLALQISSPRIDSQTVTNFLPGGSEGEIVARQPFTSTLSAQIFEARRDSSIATNLGVLSIKQAPDKLVSGFLPADSTLIRFIPPRQTLPLWGVRRFAVVFCEKGMPVSLRMRTGDL